MKSGTDKAWDAFQTALKKQPKAMDADVRASQWRADGNAAMECGNIRRAIKCYGKAQFWLDRYNKLTGRA